MEDDLSYIGSDQLWGATIGLPPPVMLQSPEALRRQRINARQEGALHYADGEVNGIFADGPFVLPLRATGDLRSEDIAHHATIIACAWLVLSNPRADAANLAKWPRALDRTYTALGLCKALVRYPSLLRHPATPADEAAAASRSTLLTIEQSTKRLLVGVDASVAPEMAARTYASSFTRNAEFRERFTDYTATLIRIKDNNDPDDRLADYRLGLASYRQQVEACVARYFPPRVSLLSLVDEIRKCRDRVYNGIIGPAKPRDESHRQQLLTDVLRLNSIAEEHHLPDMPPLPTPEVSFEALWSYLSALMTLAERRVEQDTQAQNKESGALLSATPKPMTWQEAAKIAVAHLAAGNPFPGVNAFALIVREKSGRTCSPATMLTAINRTKKLATVKAKHEKDKRKTSVTTRGITDKDAASAKATGPDSTPVDSLIRAEEGEALPNDKDELIQRVIAHAPPSRRAEAEEKMRAMTPDALREYAAMEDDPDAADQQRRRRKRPRSR